MRIPTQETGCPMSFVAPERRGRGRGIAPSCGCDAAGNVTDHTCGPRYKPQCNWSQALHTYVCVCV